METSPVICFGKGKFSQVFGYVTQNSTIKRLIAAKSYDRNKAAGQIERIFCEKAVLTRLQSSSPYIIQLIETRKDDSHLYFVMEAVLGGSIHQHLQNSPAGRVDVSIVQIYVAEIASALNTLFCRGCIHRDLKASNCLLDKTGHIKLVDFGSSKILAEVIATKTRPLEENRTYSIVGTPHCMAPEMIAQRCGYSYAVDWWALGILTFEMLCGRLPTIAAITTLENSIDHNGILRLGEDFSRSTLESIEKELQPPLSSNTSSGISCEADQLSSVVEHQWKVDFEVDLDLSTDSKQFIRDCLAISPVQRLSSLEFDRVVQHPFFGHIDWEAINSGTGPPGNAYWDRNCGYLDVEERYCSSSSEEEKELSCEEQNLFSGF